VDEREGERKQEKIRGNSFPFSTALPLPFS